MTTITPASTPAGEQPTGSAQEAPATTAPEGTDAAQATVEATTGAITIGATTTGATTEKADVAATGPAAATGIATAPDPAATGAPGPAAAGPGRPPARTAGAAPPADVWPGPPAPSGSVPILATLASGLVAAAVVPLSRPGLGWALGGVAVFAAIAGTLWHTLATRDPATRDPATRDPATPSAVDAALTTATEDRSSPAGRRSRWLETTAWGVAAITLLSVGAVRAAGWLFALCVFAAAVCVVPAVTSGRSVRGLILSGLLLPAAAVRGIGWAYRGTADLRQRTVGNLRLGLTVTITVVLVLVFGGLLASADAGFARLLGLVVPDFAADSLVTWGFVFGVATLTVLSGVFMLLAPPRVDPEPRPDGPRAIRVAEWATPVGALVALFTGFVGVQITVLFGGASYVLGPDGPDYADYARSGFGQLVAVTVLTLVVMGVVGWLAPRETQLERWLLRGLLGALGLLTLVIVASALHRMHTYQEAYGFTRLRVLVSVVELWLGVVFLLVLAAGIRLRATWLPRLVLATGVAAVMALAVLNPDGFIAEQNIARWQAAEPGEEISLDVRYLQGLSADALPALICLPEEYRATAIASITASLADDPGDWRGANLSRAHASRLLEQEEPACD